MISVNCSFASSISGAVFGCAVAANECCVDSEKRNAVATGFLAVVHRSWDSATPLPDARVAREGPRLVSPPRNALRTRLLKRPLAARLCVEPQVSKRYFEILQALASTELLRGVLSHQNRQERLLGMRP